MKPLHHLKRIILPIALMLTLAAVFCACQATPPDHLPDDGTSNDTPTGHVHTPVSDAAVEATCTSPGLTEGSHCSECGEVLAKQTEIAPLGHDLADGKCSQCSYTYSAGLRYASNGNGSCAVTGIGSCRDTDLVIPPKSPGGETVTEIAASAFQNCAELTSVTLAEGVQSIGNGAFKECYALSALTLPDTLTHIGQQAFYKCGLQELVIPESVTQIGFIAFYHCSLQSVTFLDPEGWCRIAGASITGERTPLDLSDPVQNAKILANTYSGNIWLKE